MNQLMINDIKERELTADLDVAFALCESYIKEYTMYSYIQEANGVAQAQQPMQQPMQQPQQAVQPNQAQQNGAINIGGIKIDNDTASKLVKIIVNIVSKLSQFLNNVTANIASDQAIQQMDQVQNSLENQLMDPQSADNLINDILKEDQTDTWTEEEKKTAKCILVGDFKECKLLSSANIQALTDVNNDLTAFLKQVKGSEGKTNPEQLAQTITQTLTVQNNKLAAIIGNSVEDAYRTDAHVQMSAKTYKDNIKLAANQIKLANNNIKVLEQSFKTGGAGGFFDWMFNKDIAAKKISQDCMTQLSKTLNYLRQTVQKISSDLKSAKKINSKLYNRLRTTIVNGNKGVQNFANRAASQKLGVSSQMVKKADKKQFENIQGANANI
jgi:hypothetical protein